MKKQLDLAIGNRIRAIRVSSGLSTIDLAETARMPLTDYTHGEKGNRRFSARELFAISQALRIGMTDLVSDLDNVPGR
jgi:transcriptional regulator with XRE-family HTH domain